MELTKPVERSLWRNKCFGLVEQLSSAKFGCLSREQVNSYIPYVFAITPSKKYARKNTSQRLCTTGEPYKVSKA